VSQRTTQRINGLLLFSGFFAILAPGIASAAPLTYRYHHHLFTIDPAREKWERPQEVWLYNGKEIAAPAALRVDGDTIPELPPGFSKELRNGVSREAILETLRAKISPFIDREAGNVTISSGSGGRAVFDGAGLPGQVLDLYRAAALTEAAVRSGATEVFLPVRITQPTITVTDPSLISQGIKEVVTVGDSDFSNSPTNRIHNINTGLAKFNGHLIPKDAVFSFVDVLGPVDGSTGYRRELVIKGDRTVPDYGGGLCQVNSTAYRGVWEYGFPILERQNHSYIVNHYAPVGTDATVYLPAPDMKFKNDSPGALLIQTHTVGDTAYFIFYGTRDNRTSHVIGPYIWDRTGPPPDRTEYTTDLAPGQTKKLQERVSGMKVMWYRITTKDNLENVEEVFSHYQAKPLFTQIGIDATTPINANGTADIPAGDVEVKPADAL
jgi:vancomycin resistance protein YoaR